jgi:hypothetical protein
VDYAALTGEKLADYISTNVLALADELHEMLAECQWKPWAKNRGTVNRDAFADEAVDLLHFAANLLVAVGIPEDELWERYRAKQTRNAARQEHGYDSKASKCPSCRRELDKPGALRRQISVSHPPYELAYQDTRTPAEVKCTGCGCQVGTQLPMAEIIWNEGIDVPGVIVFFDKEFFDG